MWNSFIERICEIWRSGTMRRKYFCCLCFSHIAIIRCECACVFLFRYRHLYASYFIKSECICIKQSVYMLQSNQICLSFLHIWLIFTISSMYFRLHFFLFILVIYHFKWVLTLKRANGTMRSLCRPNVSIESIEFVNFIVWFFV